MAITILATDLAELARPIGENTGKTSVRQAGVGGAAAAIEAAAESPPAVDAVLSIGIEAEGVLGLEDVKRRELAAGIRSAEIDVGGFAEVTVEAKMAHNTDVLAPVGAENIAGVAAVNLCSTLDEPVFRSGQKPRK